MRRLWLVFAQTVTVCLGIVFVVSTLKPEWLATERLGDPEPGSKQDVGVKPPDSQAVPPVVHSYADAVGLAAPSVVSVHTRKHINVPQMPFMPTPDPDQRRRDLPGFGQRGQATGLGSGVIMRDGGYVLTNYHVVQAADAIEVTLADGRQSIAELVGADPESDLAVMKITLPDLTPIRLGDDRNLKVGDVVLAIGNPFGVGQTTTLGIVSALGRDRLGVNIYENFIQTDAAINPGNSGGALVDAQGRLVGINTAIYSEGGGSLGIGFAIPVQAAETILDQIVQTGQVARGWLGVEPQDMTPDLARAFELGHSDGVILARVLTDGPAASAGLQVGDIVLAMDDQPIHDAVQFLSAIAAQAPDIVIHIQVLRDGEVRTFDVQLGARPDVTRP